MADAGRREPAADEPLHPIPGQSSLLAAPAKDAMPVVTDREAEVGQGVPVARHSVVADVPAHDGPQPRAGFRHGGVHAPPQLGFHLAQLGLQPFANRLPKNQKASLARPAADVREAEEVEGFRFTQTGALPVLGRVAAELQQARLFRVQLQLELAHTLLQFRPEAFGIVLELESGHDVVGEANGDHVAARPLLTPCLGPEIEDVMEVDVGQQRRCASALRRTLLHDGSFPFFQHARAQPLLDETQDAPVRNAMLEEPDQPFVRKLVEKAAHVQVQNPVHPSLAKSAVERIQRFMLVASRAEAVREAEEVRFVDGVQNLYHRALDDFVLQRRDPQRPLPAVGLGDVAAA